MEKGKRRERRRRRRREGILLCNGLIILGHPQEYTLKISRGSDLIGLRYCLMCICSFVCLLTCLFFILIILENPQEYTLKISRRSDLIWLRYIGSKKMFICSFVCLLTCLFFILIIMGNPQEYTLKISWGSDLIWLRYSGSLKCLFVYLFVCLFIFFCSFHLNHLRISPRKVSEVSGSLVKIGYDLYEILWI